MEFVPNIDNNGLEVCRVTLRNNQDHQDSFDIVILNNTSGRVTFKADCYDDNEEEYPLNKFYSDGGDEIILVCDDDEELIYFHLF